MRKLINGAAYLLLLVLFCACPDKTSYPLEVKEKGSLDAKLVGTWSTSDYSEVSSVKITMDEDKSYKVEVLEEGEDYTAETDIFKAWLAKVNKRKFLVLQEVNDGKSSDNYYVYDIVIGDNTFTTHTISLKGKGADLIVSVKDYQEKLKSSMDSTGFLSSDVVWKKIE